MNENIEWSPDEMIEVGLRDPQDFLKVKETLTRIGVSSRREKKLFQSCHILHKQGKYYIVHFKELFALDKKPTKSKFWLMVKKMNGNFARSITLVEKRKNKISIRPRVIGEYLLTIK